MDSWVPLIAALLVFASAMAIGLIVIRWIASRERGRMLSLVQAYASTDPHQLIIARERAQAWWRVPLLKFGHVFVREGSREKLARTLGFAGGATESAVDNAVIQKVVLLFVGLGLGLLLALSRGGILWLLVPGLAVGGFLLPNLLTYNRSLKRDEEMALRLPDALDMLNLCVESGLSFQAALSQVATNQKGPVAEEFAFALSEMQYGRSRAQALEAIAGRTRQEDIHRFVSAMLQVDKLGVPVAVVLREQAKEMRAKRYARAREQAQKVPVKILMPLMLCFLPALFIIILGPAAFSITQLFSSM